MEPILTNHALVDEAAVKKSMTRICRLRVCVLLLDALLMLGMALYFTIRGVFSSHRITISVQTVLLYALAVVCVWLGVNLPRRFTRLAMRRMEEQYQAASYEADYAFFADSLTFRSTVHPNETRLAYANVKKLLICDDLILLLSQAKLIYTLDRTRFENGTEADFWRLMNEKCPSAVPKKYRQPANP